MILFDKSHQYLDSNVCWPLVISEQHNGESAMKMKGLDVANSNLLSTKIGWKRLDLLHKQLIYPWKHIMRTENHKSLYHISRMYVLHTFGVLKNTSCCFISCKTAMTPWNLTLKKPPRNKGPKESTRKRATFQRIPWPLKIIPEATAAWLLGWWFMSSIGNLPQF